MKKVPELKVVFDTSVLYSPKASELLSSPARKLIEGNSHHGDLRIHWILPEVVLGERQYQMMSAAREKLPAIKDIERLLLVTIGIGEDNLQALVEATTKRQTDDLQLEVVSLDSAKVVWNDLIKASVFRRPPFGPSDSERGFRDSLVLATYRQVLEASPSTPSACRIALVAADARLREAAVTSTQSTRNARVVADLEELEQLINTLVANVTEEFVERIKEPAARYFFHAEAREGLYYQEHLRERIEKEFARQLSDIPEGADTTAQGAWLIAKPQFVKKEGQRVTWSSQITVQRRALRRQRTTAYDFIRGTLSPLVIGLTRDGATVPATLTDWMAPGSSRPANLSLGSPQTVTLRGDGTLQTGASGSAADELAYEGETKFDVHWSVSVSATKLSLSKGTVEEALFETTAWQTR